MAKTKMTICPYCGETQPAEDRCRSCGGLFEPLSRRATHNAMGPWFWRDEQKPHQPGCSYEMLVKLIERGQVTKYSIIRGPTTKQFWTVAKHVPGLAHLLGYCHSCDASVDPGDHGCHACGVPFGAYLDRNYLGLPEIQPLPWEPGTNEGEGEGLGQADQPWRPQRLSERISSFASDEELTARAEARSLHESGVGAVAPTSVAASVGARGAPDTGATASARAIEADRTSAAEAQPSEEFIGSPLARGMRRRIAKQQRTIRVLGILLVAVAAVAIIELIMLVQTTTPITTEAGAGAPGATVAEGTQRSPAPPPSAADGERTQDEGQIGEETGDPAAAAGISRFAQEYQRALVLIEAAEDDAEQLSVRISDCQEALRIVQLILDEAPEDEQPVDLVEQLNRIKATLERLKLQEFFPGGG